MRHLRHPLLGVAFAIAAAGCGAKDQPASAATAKVPALDPALNNSPGDAALKAADQARIQGRATAPVWVIEVSDFQCPYCKMWHDSIYASLKREYVDGGKIRLAYINFPLPRHKNARPAAEAAMCVAAQGKFWPMQDALFNEQDRWEGLADPAPVLDELAKKVGADVPAMRACIAAKTMKPLIEGDIDRATAAGVGSTPTLLIGRDPIVGAQPLSVYREAIERAARESARPGS
jgi:protein-disulfide isomerase